MAEAGIGQRFDPAQLARERALQAQLLEQQRATAEEKASREGETVYDSGIEASEAALPAVASAGAQATQQQQREQLLMQQQAATMAAGKAQAVTKDQPKNITYLFTAGFIKSMWGWMLPSFGFAIYPIVFLYIARWPSRFMRRFIPGLGEAWVPNLKMPRTMLKVAEFTAIFMTFVVFGAIHIMAFILLAALLWALFLVFSTIGDVVGSVLNVFG